MDFCELKDNTDKAGLLRDAQSSYPFPFPRYPQKTKRGPLWSNDLASLFFSGSLIPQCYTHLLQFFERSFLPFILI